MKIGLVIDDSLDRADGVQQYVTTLGEWFRGKGHEVHYLAGKTRQRNFKNVHSLSATVNVRFNKNRLSIPLPASKSKIRRLLAEKQFDVLHVQMPYSPMLAEKVILNAPPATAVIGTFHILPFSRLESASTRALGLLLKRSLKRFDRIFSVSAPAAGFARRTFGIETDVLPNAVDLRRFRAGRKLEGYDDGRLNVVYMGRLVERKGCRHLLAAFTRLHAEGALAGTRLIIAGVGPLEDNLKAYVERHGLGGVVEFVGFVPEADKPDYLASADIAVFPSLGGESFGIILVETMAAGAGVVIAGNNPGYSFVMGGRNEQLVDPEDPAAFAGTLKRFLSTPAAIKKAKAAQAGLIKAFDVNTVGAELLKVYKQVLHSRREVR